MEELKEYLKEELSIGDLIEMVNSVAWYNGNLDWLQYQENDEEFFENYFNSKFEVARAIYFGSYNFNDEYIQFDGYGNVKSCSEYEYREEIESYRDYIIEAYIEVYEEDYQYFKDDKAYQLIEEYKEEHQ